MGVKIGGLDFKKGPNGVIVDILHDVTDNAEFVRSVHLSHEDWRKVLQETTQFIDVNDPSTIPEPPPTSPSIVDIPSDLAVEIVKDATTVEELDALRAQEDLNPHYTGGRKTVLAAIEHRRAEIAGV